MLAGGVSAALERRSAPVGSVAEAYPAGKARSSAHLHGFTDASFQPAFQPESEKLLDATSAAALSAWAAQVTRSRQLVWNIIRCNFVGWGNSEVSMEWGTIVCSHQSSNWEPLPMGSSPGAYQF